MSDLDQRCPGCFRLPDTPGDPPVPCPHCGFAPDAPRPPLALPLGTLLAGRFVIGGLREAPDGCVITYRAWDPLGAASVLVQEYLPEGFAVRAADGVALRPLGEAQATLVRAGLEQFEDEARRLARLDHPHVMAVRESFAANDTAYRVTDDLPGCTLALHLARVPGGRLAQPEALALLERVLAGLAAVHGCGLLHRELSPETVFLAEGQSGRARALLTGLRAAREAIAARGEPAVRAIRPGFAALERYSGEGQGTWTDVYAAAALGYWLLTGVTPRPASVRAVQDDLAPAATFGVARPVSDALARAMTVRPQTRTPTVAALQAELATGPRPGRIAALGQSQGQQPQTRNRRPLRLLVMALLAVGLAWLLVAARAAWDLHAYRAAQAVDSIDAWRGYLAHCGLTGCGQRAAAEQRVSDLLLAEDRARADAAAEARRAAAARRAESAEVAAAVREAARRVTAPSPDRPAPPPQPETRLPEMVRIPAGSFLMGSPETEPGRAANEGPRRRVRIAAFELAKTEVTFAQWDACVADSGCRPQAEDQGWGRGQRPAINLSWDDAMAYIRWLNARTGQGYRLPSEAEWEYAARAGTTTAFSTGRCISGEQANFNAREPYAGCHPRPGDYPPVTRPVASFAANPWGLHDLHGNVQEWVADCWNGDYYDAPGDGRAWLSGNCDLRVLRGGGWAFGAAGVRAAARDRYSTGVRYLGIGFRVARTF